MLSFYRYHGRKKDFKSIWFNIGGRVCSKLQNLGLYQQGYLWTIGFSDPNWNLVTNFLQNFLFFLPIADCQCMEKFKKCLRGLDTDLSRDLQHIFFELLNMKCYDLQSGSMCEKYSKWFDSCDNYVTYLTIKTRRL